MILTVGMILLENAVAVAVAVAMVVVLLLVVKRERNRPSFADTNE
jgi:hypothetical protein